MRELVSANQTEVAFIPPQVDNLARCERELAIIIYQHGAMTAKALEAKLPRQLSYSALRSMLARLCRKGILSRRKLTGSHMTTDRRIPYLYRPAISSDVVKKTALTQLAGDYFDGSMIHVVRTAVELLNDELAKPSSRAIRQRRPKGTSRVHIAA